MDSFDWREELSVGYAGLTSAQRQEWMERTLRAVAREGGWIERSVGVHETPFPHRVFRLVGGRLTTELRVTEPDGPCLVTGRGARDDSQIAVWRAASDEALANLGGVQKHPWAAIIGVHPDYRFSNMLLRLAAPARLGDLQLTPYPFLIEELRPSVRFDLGVRQPHSWPIRVDGATAAWHPREAGRLAGAELRLACAVLTVAWRVPMTMRVESWVDGSDPTAYVQSRASDFVSDLLPYEVNLEQWMIDGLIKAAGDPYLAHALGAFLDGNALELEFPSQACIAYVGAIESVEKLPLPPKRRTQGSGSAFRRGLDRVLYYEEAQALHDAYDRRSRTAHEGRVYGTQASLGVEGVIGLLADDTSREFDHLLAGLRKAAQRLSTLKLGGPQTWQRNKNDMPGGLVAAQMIGAENWLG
jgi:hypothetical protein